LSADLAGILRWLKPERRIERLVPRDESLLTAAETASGLTGPIMPDATAYIHARQGRLPPAAVPLFSRPLLHSPIALAEIAASVGWLDPRHPKTATRARILSTMLGRVPSQRIVELHSNVVLGAAVLAGLLARIQGYAAADYRSLLSDAMILLGARARGCTVLTANIRDFDLMTQIVADARVVFYRALPASGTRLSPVT
jgi:hypothetical protein